MTSPAARMNRDPEAQTGNESPPIKSLRVCVCVCVCVCVREPVHVGVFVFARMQELHGEFPGILRPGPPSSLPRGLENTSSTYGPPGPAN